jgi:outer membrane protein
MKKSAGIVSFLALAAGFGLAVTVAQAESIYDAMAQAYMTNPTLRAARAGQRATDELVPQALSGWRPVITANALLGRSHSEVTTADRDKTTGKLLGTGTETTLVTTPGNMNIGLSQPIFSGFRTINSTKVAEATVAAGQQGLLSTEQNVLYSTAQAYFDVIRDRQVVDLRKKLVGVLKEQLNASNERFKAGEITNTDVAQSQARLSTAEGLLAASQADLATSVSAYVKVVGNSPGTLKYSKTPKLPGSLDSALATASETNPNVLAAALVEEASVHQIEVEKSFLLPTITLNVQAGASDDLAHQFGNANSAEIFGQISVPIYDGGFTYSSVRQAKQVASEKRIQVIEANRAVREAVANAWNALVAAREIIVAAKSQVSASTLALEGVRLEYQAGTRTTLDVLNAESEVFNGRIVLASAERDEVVFTYLLIAAMGHLTAQHLKLAVNYYDANSNYQAVRNKWIGTGAETVK